MIIETICPSCHEKVSINDNKDVGFCFNCGSKILIKDEKKGEKISNNQLIENYYNLALTASRAKNNSEAENYCNKILELDPTHYLAWQLKGHSVGWDSSLSNIRLEEAITYYNNAIEYAPSKSVKEEMEKSNNEDLENITFALLELQCDRFSKWPDQEESVSIAEIALLTLRISYGKKDYLKKVARKIYETITWTWDGKILSEFRNDNGGHPNDEALKYVIFRRKLLDGVFLSAAAIDDESNRENISRFRKMISMWNDLTYAKSYDCIYDYNGNKNWCISSSIKSSTIQDEIDKYNVKIRKMENEIEYKENEERRLANEEKEKIRRIAEQEKKNRIDAYWEKHADLKAKYVAEKKDLTEQLRRLQKEIESSADIIELQALSNQLDKLISQKDNLSIFKRKEKIELDNQIKEIGEKINELRNKINDTNLALGKQMDKLKTRVKEINNELEKDRQERTDENARKAVSMYATPMEILTSFDNADG